MELGAVIDFVGVAIRSMVVRSMIEALLVCGRSKIFLAHLLVHTS